MSTAAQSTRDTPSTEAPPVVLVTGVSSGIGFDIAQHLTSLGYFVFGSVRTHASRDEVTAKMPSNFTALLFDVTDRTAIRDSVRSVEERLNGRRLYGLVNNAGIVEPGPMQLLEDERFDHAIAVNLMGTRNVINAFLPSLGADGGEARTGRPATIVNISSLSGVINTPINGAYCVSKHAQESLGEVYRRELSLFGIRVVSIQPGPIESQLWDKNIGAMARFMPSSYGRMTKRANEVMRSAQADAIPAIAVSRCVERALKSRRPRNAYIITKGRLRAWVFAHLVPARWMDRILAGQLSS